MTVWSVFMKIFWNNRNYTINHLCFASYWLHMICDRNRFEYLCGRIWRIYITIGRQILNGIVFHWTTGHHWNIVDVWKRLICYIQFRSINKMMDCQFCDLILSVCMMIFAILKKSEKNSCLYLCYSMHHTCDIERSWSWSLDDEPLQIKGNIDCLMQNKMRNSLNFEFELIVHGYSFCSQ